MTKQSRSRNFLSVPLAEFRSATKVFARRWNRLGQVLLAFEGGFLSIESGEATAVMRAEGEWHGRASFSPEILRALVKVPPAQDPIPISYADGHLLIGTMTISCCWRTVSRSFIDKLANPDMLGLLVLERTLPRAEMKGTELGKQIRSARMAAELRIRNAAAQLAQLGVTETEIHALVERKITRRLEAAASRGK